jgi:acyl carrier protein
MAKPTLEAFTASVRKALAEVDVPEEELTLLDVKGPSFHFYDDGGIDSLDMLDVAFQINRELGTRIQLEKLKHDNEPMTLQNLYDSIH